MKKVFTVALCCFITSFSFLSAVIVETAHFSELLNYVTPKTLVLLDIDDTLLVPRQTLGSDVWFQYRMKQYEAKGMPTSEALKKTVAEWEAIRHLSQVKIVEEGAEKIVEELQRRDCFVMGLTLQELTLTARTIEQLTSLHIDLAKATPFTEDFFVTKQGVFYRKGILFTSGKPKGVSLFQFLDAIDYHPERIVVIDDKISHVRNVEQAAEARGIEFIGLRYSYSDERVARFSKEIADVQLEFSTFEHLLSDEEAALFLK